MHWGTVVLSLEPIMEPPIRFKDNAGKYGFTKDNTILFKIGKSDYKRISFMTLETNRYSISVICQYWHQSTPFAYVLKTSINSEEFGIYLTTKAYK